MSGGFNPVNLVSQAALASVTGGTSLLVTQLTRQLVSSIAQQVLQNVGQQLGVPQPMIDAAQGSLAASFGDVQGATQNYQEALDGISTLFPNASPAAQGDLQRSSDKAYDAIKEMTLQAAQDAEGQDSEGNVRGSGRGGGNSWLMAIAKGLGNMLSAQADKLEAKMNSTDWEDAGQAAEFQAQSQEFGLAMNTATNAIKTIGEALSTMARKQ